MSGSGDDELVTHKLAQDVLTLKRFLVEVIAGADAGLRVEVDGEEMAIGTAKANDLVLNDRAVSRYHCVIRATEHGFSVRDFDSTNGVRLGGYRVGSAIIKHGAELELGRSRLRLVALKDPLMLPLSSADRFGSLVGTSAAMRRLFAVVPKVAPTDTTVLLEGETGTGKTLLARAIHDSSARSSQPFVVVDCASITPTLIEAQLFGHLKGAFTGAVRDEPGAFVAAGGGTLFLDEIGELPLHLQPKLLRVLEERVVTPLGATGSRPVDVRVISATNRDLRKAVNDGRFRADLFYRLHVVALRVPPLRERPDDIAHLAGHFFEQCAPPGLELPAAVIATWQQRDWKGNARELRSAVDRYLLLGAEIAGFEVAGSVVAGSEVGSAANKGSAQSEHGVPFRVAKDRVVQAFEQSYLRALIERTEGNIAKAAREGGMDRNHLRELLRKHGLLPSR